MFSNCIIKALAVFYFFNYVSGGTYEISHSLSFFFFQSHTLRKKTTQGEVIIKN